MHVVSREDHAEAPEPGALETLLSRVAHGDRDAFDGVYGAAAGTVFGLVRRVLRDPAQSEEVAQEVMVEVWRSAARFDPSRGSALAWIVTIAHRRAVDRVRASQAAADRDRRIGQRDYRPPFDEVTEEIERRLEREQVRRCLKQLSELQHESVFLAYFRGYTYRETAELLHTALGTVKTRMRDGLIRLRDCLGVAS